MGGSHGVWIDSARRELCGTPVISSLYFITDASRYTLQVSDTRRVFMDSEKLARTIGFPDVEMGRDAIRGTPAIAIPLLGITASEVFLFFGHTEYALWGYVVTLLVCALAPIRFDSETSVLQAFALVPLFRLVNLGMPIFFELTIFWLPLVYGPLIPGLYLITRSQPQVNSSSKIKHLFLVPLAVPLSILLAEIEYSILQPEALIPTWNIANLVAVSVVMIVFVSAVEELLFRGILQRTLEDRLGTWSGLGLTSVVFGLMHSGYGMLAEIGFAVCVGFLLGLIYDRTGSLLLVVTVHGLLNLFLFAVIPLRGSLLPL